jgi:hypothetical protein
MAGTPSRPTPRGNDPIPIYSQLAMTTYEVLSVVTLAFVLVWFFHGIRRSGAIDSIRSMMIGWLSGYWLDPFLNFLRPRFAVCNALDLAYTSAMGVHALYTHRQLTCRAGSAMSSHKKSVIFTRFG